MTNWKVVAGFGGAGFVLSLVFGMVSGNPFGVMLLRMLISSVAAAGIGFGLSFVIDRFLPEIAAGGGASDGSGMHVDIVVPGENPHTGSAGSADFAEAAAEAEAVDLDIAEAEDVGGLEEAAPASAESRGSPPGEAEPAAEVLAAEEAGDAESVQELDIATEAEAEPAARPGASAGGLGVLGGRSGTAGALGQQDPEVVARAVRTMMRRDEEG